jgi:hypothetical protein
MQLDLRNPAWGLFNNARRGSYEALFSITLVGVIIAAKGTPLLSGRPPEIFPHTLWNVKETLNALCIVFAFTGLALLLSASKRAARWKTVFSICGLAYLPLAISGLFVIYFRALVEGGAQLVPQAISAAGMDRWLDAVRLTPELGTLRLFIYPILLAGGLFSSVVLGKLQLQYKLPPYPLIGHRILILLAVMAFIRIL